MSTPFYQKKEINEAVSEKVFIYALRVRWVATKGAATGIREEGVGREGNRTPLAMLIQRC